MKTDRELLELAAKAADMDCVMTQPFIGLQIRGGNLWSPLTDDGDALRLAAGLILNVLASKACILVEDEKGVECIEYLYGPEDYTSAWRRAIVRAAAAIGEAMK